MRRYSAKTLGPTEAALHEDVVAYLKRCHPGVVFRTDFAAGLKLQPWQAAAHAKLQEGPGYPDLWIAAPRSGFHGMYLELKKPGATLYLKNGNLSTNEHIQKQAAMLQRLVAEGYYANFAQGYDDAIEQIERYLGTKKPARVEPVAGAIFAD